MAQDKSHLPFNLFGYWMVIISQWKSWQINVFTFMEQFEVPRGISYFSNTFFSSLYDDSCTFQMRKDQEVKVLHGMCWLEPRNCTHHLQGVLETWFGLFSYPTSLATVAVTGLSMDPSWTHQSPLLKSYTEPGQKRLYLPPSRLSAISPPFPSLLHGAKPSAVDVNGVNTQKKTVLTMLLSPWSP